MSILLRLLFLDAEYIDAKRGGERRQRRVGTAEGRRNDPNNEKNQDRASQDAGGTKHREDIVARSRQRDSLPCSEREQQDSETEEQKIDRRKSQSISVHILLRIL